MNKRTELDHLIHLRMIFNLRIYLQNKKSRFLDFDL